MTISTRYPKDIRQAIRARKPFQTGQIVGYVTAGGTYVIASSPIMNDDDLSHDLLAITPWNTVAQLRPTANPDYARDALETED